MKKCIPLFLLLSIGLLQAQIQPVGKQDDDFRWQDAAKEVEHLPFKKSFIDSIRLHHKIPDRMPSLRTISSRINCPAETLVYDIGWGPFRAGFVVLTTNRDTVNSTIRLGAKALSNNFVGTFYKMRDYIISTIDANGLYPIMFEQHLREGKKYKADGYILYDNINRKVIVQERKFRIVDAPLFTHDYISVLYYIRNQNFTTGDTFTHNLYVHNKVHPIFFQCKERRKIEVEAGTFDAILLEPRLAGDGRAFNKKDKLEVWVTNDNNRVPILIKTKIKVGSIVARLIWNSNQNPTKQPAPLQTTSGGPAR